MAVLEFKAVPVSDKETFRVRFQEYLEEMDLIIGDPVEPNFHLRFPEFDSYFLGNPQKVPFKIFHIANPEDQERIAEPIGFFLLNVITAADFPKGVPSIFPYQDTLVASLSDFFILPQFRSKGVAWLYYDSIIKLCTEQANQWHVCFECDIRNKPAIAFYDKVLDRIKKDYHFETTKYKYRKKERKNNPYFFYQIRFDFEKLENE